MVLVFAYFIIMFVSRLGDFFETESETGNTLNK